MSLFIPPILILVLSIGISTWFLGYGRKKGSPPVYKPLRPWAGALEMGVYPDEFFRRVGDLLGPAFSLLLPSQTFLLSAPLISQVYSTPSKNLSFIPIRIDMGAKVFGIGPTANYSPRMPTNYFDLHSRGFSKGRIGPIVDRYLMKLREDIAGMVREVEGKGEKGVEVDMTSWVWDMLYRCSQFAFFGPQFDPELKLNQAFHDFDDAFHLIAGGVPSIFLRKAMRGRKKMIDGFVEYLKTEEYDVGEESKGEGACEVIRTMISFGKEEKWPREDIAALMFADHWALTANAPHAAFWAALHIFQSPDLLLRLRKEISDLKSREGRDGDLHLDLGILSLNLPLLTSCIWESLRLYSTSFSGRQIEADTYLSTPLADGQRKASSSANDTSVYLRKGGKVICCTRTVHLDPSIWGEDVEMWKGDRFLMKSDGGVEDDEEVRIKLRKYLLAFGGGISQCEGRHFALAELKSFLCYAIDNFDISILPDPSGVPIPEYQNISSSGMERERFVSPGWVHERIGLGTFHPRNAVRGLIRRKD